MRDTIESEKMRVAYEAVTYVEDGMILGVGCGSTMKYFINYLKELVEEGLQIRVVPTSKETRDACIANEIPLYEGEYVPVSIDLCVDGADEFDENLNLIKGGGGHLLWEKIVASTAKRIIIITDSRKHVKKLGETFRLPLEVIPYAIESVKDKLSNLGISATLRMKDDIAYRTEEGNYILDCNTGPISDAYALGTVLSNITGVVEHGLFLDLCNTVLQGCGQDILVYDKTDHVEERTC